ncbi:MAG: hypothetical protein QOF84_4369 [Streptomyces sp.]|nr:hypothetical protein [Streptomyces sp.]
MIILRSIYNAVIAAGSIWVHIPPLPPLSGPPPGHPERPCPDIPLSALEQTLEREFAS